MPYDSFYNDSNMEEVNEMIGPMHVGRFESSEDESPRQVPQRSQWSSFGSKYDSQYAYRNHP